MSQFDPNLFLEATLTEPTEKRPPLPEGDYTAQIGTITARTWQGRKDPSKSGIAWDIPLTLTIPDELQAQGSPKEIRIVDGMMLDITAEGMIDNGRGKNGRLRMYREATKLNGKGDTFSAKRMEGTFVLVKVKHELYEGNIYEKVGMVAPL